MWCKTPKWSLARRSAAVFRDSGRRPVGSNSNGPGFCPGCSPLVNRDGDCSAPRSVGHSHSNPWRSRKLWRMIRRRARHTDAKTKIGYTVDMSSLRSQRVESVSLIGLKRFKNFEDQLSPSSLVGSNVYRPSAQGWNGTLRSTKFSCIEAI